MRSIASHITWFAVAILGACGLAIIALNNGEKIKEGAI